MELSEEFSEAMRGGDGFVFGGGRAEMIVFGLGFFLRKFFGGEWRGAGDDPLFEELFFFGVQWGDVGGCGGHFVGVRDGKHGGVVGLAGDNEGGVGSDAIDVGEEVESGGGRVGVWSVA